MLVLISMKYYDVTICKCIDKKTSTGRSDCVLEVALELFKKKLICKI